MTTDPLDVVIVGAGQAGLATHATFRPDLDDSVEWGDQRFGLLNSLFTKFAGEQGLSAPDLPDPAPLVVAFPRRSAWRGRRGDSCGRSSP